MAGNKAADLRNKLGAGGMGGPSGPASPNPFAQPAGETKKEKAIDPHIKAGQIDKGHDVGKGAHKTLGGAGGAGGRPKV